MRWLLVFMSAHSETGALAAAASNGMTMPPNGG